MTEKTPPPHSTDVISPKYTSLEGWYLNEQKNWKPSSEQLDILDRRRAKRIGDEAMRLSAGSDDDTPPPQKPPDAQPVDATINDSETEAVNKLNHEAGTTEFRATTFEACQQLSNPLPDHVIDKLIESQGDINLYHFVEPDEFDKAITKEQEEDYLYNGIKSLRKDFSYKVDGRSTFVPHFVFSQYATQHYAQ